MKETNWITLYQKELDFVVKTICTKKTQGPDGFIDDFYWIVKEEIMLILHKFLHKIEGEGILPNSALLWYQNPDRL